jgi:hypothetical protein
MQVILTGIARSIHTAHYTSPPNKLGCLKQFLHTSSLAQVTWKDPDMETSMVQITVFTDADVRKQSNSDAIASCVTKLLGQAQISGHLEDTLTELTIDLSTNAHGELECRYYFVAPDRRVLFWEDDFEARHLFGEVKGVTSGHISTFYFCSSHILCFSIAQNMPWRPSIGKPYASR